MGDPFAASGVIDVPFTPGSSVHGEEGAGETVAAAVVGVVLDAVLGEELLKLVQAVGCNVTVASAAPPVLGLLTLWVDAISKTRKCFMSQSILPRTCVLACCQSCAYPTANTGGQYNNEQDNNAPKHQYAQSKNRLPPISL